MDTATQIKQAIENLRQAMVNADSEALDSLTDEALTYGHTNGTVEDKATFIAAICGKRNVFTEIKLSDQVPFHSDDVVSVRHRMQAHVLVNGTPTDVDIRVLQVWQKRDDVWKLIARQAYKI